MCRGLCVGERRADLVVESKVVVELKAVTELASVRVARVPSTMKADGIPAGLLINFHVERLVDGVRRVVL